MKNVIRWILFIPVSVLTVFLSNIVWEFVFLKFGLGFLGLDHRFEFVVTVFFSVFIIPVLISMLSIYAGVYVAPKRKVAAIVLLCLISISSIFSLAMGSMAFSPVIASILGAVLAYFKLKGNGVFDQVDIYDGHKMINTK